MLIVILFMLNLFIKVSEVKVSVQEKKQLHKFIKKVCTYVLCTYSYDPALVLKSSHPTM